VLQAASGEDALHLSQHFNGTIDVLLTDVVMPGINGRLLSDRLTQQRPETKVVYMSGYTDDAITHHGVLDEGVVLIHKPIKGNVLANRIREVLDGAGDRKGVTSSAHGLHGLKILLVDDNEHIRKLVQVYIKDYNCRVDIAENGKIAVEKFKDGGYDLVLMDMEMPVMDGLTAVREVRKWELEKGAGETVIIAMTGNSDKEAIGECLKAGYSNHIAKPMKKDQLINALIAGLSARTHDACSTEEDGKEKCVAYVDTDLQGLIPEYFEERQEDIKKMQDAVKVQDYETIRLLGHSIKGTGGSFGFHALTDIGAHLEAAAKAKDSEAVTRLVYELEEYIDNVQIMYE
jgi:CheY-like chemotaxis protein/HPt (histidine-containing phosphotransfer) domain-containing protein